MNKAECKRGTSELEVGPVDHQTKEILTTRWKEKCMDPLWGKAINDGEGGDRVGGVLCKNEKAR